MTGAFRKNPQRKRPNEPKDGRTLGDPPARLPAEALEFWHEIHEHAPAGVLAQADRWCVELAARLMAKATAERISSAELNVLSRLLAAMGMNPADRSKLSVQTEKPKNEFAALAEEARGLRR